MSKWLYRKGELTNGKLDVALDAAKAPVVPWMRSGLIVGDAAGGIELPADQNERVILISSGSEITVNYQLSNGEQAELKLFGRQSVFHGPCDVLYLPNNTSATVTGSAKVIIGQVIANHEKHVVLMRKDEIPVLIRGAGRETRQIHNFCMPDTMDTDRIISVEGIVPAGNWSGVPAHKHDCFIPNQESHLEEIYYFETKATRGSTGGADDAAFGYFRGYASDGRNFEVDAAVFNQDVVLIPHGYHGPVAAAPGYDLYFFNVMAGNDPTREWLIADDPTQEWIRDTWEQQKPDARLPYQANQSS